ncbi:MAG: CPBP family intramembrane metalloprotease [Candidatus Aegiribacteria sp.]|nr:CPBP family intramembrane metalloprotease [Candidatus Aegiribacteria sp.]
MTKLLRCKPINPGIANPEKSSLRALVAVTGTIVILCLFELVRRSPQAGILGPGAQFEQFGDLIPAFIAFILFLLPAGIFVTRAHEPLNSVGISRTNLWQSVVISFVFVVLMFYIQNGELLEKLQGLEQRHGIRLIYFAFIGFEEEILFRGYLQTRLVAWLGKWQGWAMASVIMALGHFPLRMVIEDKALGDAFIDSLGLIPVSLFFGFLMLRTKNVLAPAIIHTFTNWISELD